MNAKFAADVRAGLTRTGQKMLPSEYLYDEVGSALFEAITVSEEYGLTRADQRLVRQIASELTGVLDHAPAAVIELGSGNGTKTRYILEALPAVPYYPIDVSRRALESCSLTLSRYAQVCPVEDSYLPGLAHCIGQAGELGPVLVLFLGSTIGNFDRDCAVEFLRSVRSLLRPEDALLVGADLVKDADRMLLAYDDAAGVTAAFNRNVLARVNRELRGDLPVRAFAHEARYTGSAQRIEMHLRATTRVDTWIEGAECRVRLDAGDTIWTESSHKFHPDQLTAMAKDAGLIERRLWVDREWPFAECLWSPAG